MSRMRITRCWRSGSSAIASPTSASVSRASSRSSGSASQLDGNVFHPPGYGSPSGRKRSGSTAGSNVARAGTVRPSRSARLIARLVRMRKIHVFSEARPSKRCEAVEHAEPRLLHDLLGDRGAAHVAAGDAQHQGLVALDELDERGLVAALERREDLLVARDHDADPRPSERESHLTSPSAAPARRRPGRAPGAAAAGRRAGTAAPTAARRRSSPRWRPRRSGRARGRSRWRRR